jgi:hypothetical protein
MVAEPIYKFPTFIADAGRKRNPHFYNLLRYLKNITRQFLTKIITKGKKG